jgi:hypothetical protein
MRICRWTCWLGFSAKRRAILNPVDAFHGTKKVSAVAILAEGFKKTRSYPRTYRNGIRADWLGPGIYFFDQSCILAENWAKRVFPTQPVTVLRAAIDLSNFIDFVADPRKLALIQVARQQLLLAGAEESALTESDIFEYLVEVLESEGQSVAGIRSSFVDGLKKGKSIIPGSSIIDQNHIQIVVRYEHQVTAIKNISTVICS